MDARVLKKRIEDRCSGSASGMCIRCDECGDPGIGQQLFGTDTAAGWAAYGKLDLIFWTVSSALGAAVTTFAGQNYGAGKMDRVYKTSG